VTPIRIVLADDHIVLRSGLKALLDAENDLDVVGEAGDGIDCIKQVVELAPDIAVVDINMPHCDGLAALETMREQAPDTRVLILTMHDDIGYLQRALSLGASGYVLKQAASEELLSAIRTVHHGGVYLHPDHARILADDRSHEYTTPAAPLDEKHTRYESLSEREAEVFKAVALGYRNSEIAETSHLSVKTVETYKARLMQKLDVHSRADLVRYALELGILE